MANVRYNVSRALCVSRIPLNEYRVVLYMIYFPQHLKYAEVTIDDENSGMRVPIKVKNVKSETWSLSIFVAWAVFIHLQVHPPTFSLHAIY